MAEETPPSLHPHASYLAMLAPWLERSSPVTLLMLLLLGGITLWYQNAEVDRLHVIQKGLVEQLLAEKERRVELALRVGACEARRTQNEPEWARPGAAHPRLFRTQGP